jgi:uncharacterized protein YeaO (DUF488 family)
VPRLRDTYHAALQHGHVEPAESDLVVGVVRHPVYGIEASLDRNVPALAPPEELLDDFESAAEGTTHDEAWVAENFADRYRDHLENPEAREAMDDLLAELESRDVWLVCYENTEDKRCHRTILRDVLRERTGGE